MRFAAIAVAGALAWAAEPRTVLSNATLLGGPSRDGRYVSLVDPASGNLALYEVASGKTRLLTHKAQGSKEYAYFSAISPDSKRVAYAWFNSRGFYDLRVIDVEGANERVVYSNAEAGFVQPCAWTPDSRQILTLLFRSDNISQIVLAPADGGAPKVLRSLNWVYPKRMDLSPDGRSIVYDSFAGDAGGPRTIYLLSTDGSSERTLVREPGNHLFPLWMPDGKSIVYLSDRSGTMDAWQMRIDNREAKLIRRDLGRALPMGITKSGELFYGVHSGVTDVFVTKLGAPSTEALRATIRFPGRNRSPAWSTDGKALAFLSRRGSENFGVETRSIVIRRLDSDEEMEVSPTLSNIERVRWSPDGRTLLVSGSDGRGRGGLYTVDIATSALRPLMVEPGVSHKGYEGAWSADGATVYYLRGDELRARVIASKEESTLYRGEGLCCLAVSSGGIAVADARGVTLVGGERRSIALTGVTELEWGRELVAGRGPELWRVSQDGSVSQIETPGNRMAGFALHPDGVRVAMTAGNTKSEIRVLELE